nr:fibrous sheath CABYR-binding protein-like [Procambarus clarkii]
MLRSTIPSYDRFQCLERLMCSMATTQIQPEASSPVQPQPAINSPIQQVAQDASAVQQGFPGFQQPPIFQQGPQNALLQNPGLQTSAFQPPAFQNPGFQGPGFQSPGFQSPGFQSPGFQSPGFQNPTLQNPAFQSPQFQPPPGQFLPQFQAPPSGQVGQGNFQSLQSFPGANFQSPFPNQRENLDTPAQNTVRREHGPPLLRRRPIRRRRPQRNGFFSFLSGLGKRKKRSVLDDVLGGLGGFTSNRFLGLLDQMMTQYSFYPYTHAAYMGYTGSPDRCETMYPSCPSTPEEMIDVFNNIHKYYPGGVPFKDKLPWPLSFLLP